MPASSIDLRFTREDSTYGAGSRVEAPGSETSGIVTLTIPAATGTVGWSTPWNTRGGASTFHGSTQPAPDGNGWFLHETAVLNGYRVYNDAVTTATIDFESFSGSINANVYMRFYKYTISTGAYIKIGDIYDVSTSFQQSRNAVMSATLQISGPFDSDNILYVDCLWYFNTGTSTARTVNLRTGNGISVLSLRIRPNSEIAPANDNLANAIELPNTTTGQVSASNFYSSYEAGEVKNGPAGDGVVYNKVYGGLGTDANGSLWWKYTVPTDGSAPEKIYFDTHGTLTTTTTDGETGGYVRLDTRLRVFTSPTPLAPVHSTLVLIAENDDSGSYYPFSSEGSNAEVTIDSPTPGQTYFIQVLCQTRGATSNEAPTATPPGGSFGDLRHGLMRLNWAKLWRGAYIQPPNVVYDYSDLATIGNWGDNYAGMPGATPFHQLKQYHGYTAIWQAFGYPDPCFDPLAYNLATKRCHCGDQSIDETGNNSEIYWDPATVVLPNVYRLNGTQIWDMGGSNQYSGVGNGTGSNGNDIASGGFASLVPQFGFTGGLANWSTYWGFCVFNPIGLAFDPQVWSYTGSQPSGTVGVVYSKECADIVSFKVRPAAVGASSHPDPDSGVGQTIVGEWWELPNNSPTPPEFGIYRRSSDQLLVCRTNTPYGGWPIALPGDMRTMAGVQLIGTVTFTAGTRTQITTSWTVPPQFQLLELADTDTFTAADEYYAGFGVDFVLNDDTMGNQIASQQAGLSGLSFTRHIDGQDLDFELELKLPCYAFMYAAPQYQQTVGSGSYFFESDCSATTGWTHADPFAIVSGRFQFVTSPQDAYLDLGGSAQPAVEAIFDFEPPSDLSGIGGGEFVSFYEGGTRHVYGNLQNLTGTVVWQIGAGNVLTSTGLVQAGSHTYKVQVIVSDTNGSIIVYRDGSVHSQVHGVDTRNGGVAGTVDRILFGAHGSTTYLDNVKLGPITPLTDACPGLEVPPNLIEPPLRLVQRDDDNGLNTDGSQTPRLLGTGGVQRASSEQRSRYPRLQTRNEKGYR